jgi:hypothetical protein
MTTLTGNAIEWYKWEAVKQAIIMETKGLRSRMFKIARPRLLAELGLPPRTKSDKMLAAVEKKIEETKKLIKPGEIEP